MRGLSLVAATGDPSSLRCAGLSLSRPLLLRSTGSRRAGSVVVAHGPTCSAACGTFPDQGLNPCPLHWQADSQQLHHQGSPKMDLFLKRTGYCVILELQGRSLASGVWGVSPCVHSRGHHCSGIWGICLHALPAPGKRVK